MTPCFAVRREILIELLKDKEYVERLEKAKNLNEVIEVLKAFAENKGYKVAEV
jgi:mannitol/fructose-specific phosphotransferase system IIA component